ncbi:MAG TPA: hypothetical protein VIG86_02490 [Candidatus Dormibacteraeota bacterium]|jgi:hypothetical protein
MPWTLLIRILTGVLFWRLAGARRRAAAAQAAGRTAGRAAASSPAMRRRVREARETASLASRVLITVGFGTATALCLAGGTSSVVLSPRWIGGVLLGVGFFFAVLTIREARLARRLVKVRRLRRRDRELRGEIRG